MERRHAAGTVGPIVRLIDRLFVLADSYDWYVVYSIEKTKEEALEWIAKEYNEYSFNNKVIWP